MELVSFESAGMSFLVDVARVREIARGGATGGDSDDAWMELRGERLAVVDFRARLGDRTGAAAAGGGDRPVMRTDRPVLVLDHPAGVVGLRVDAVGDVRTAAEEEVAPIPSHYLDAVDWMRGLVREGDGFAVLVDAGELPVR